MVGDKALCFKRLPKKWTHLGLWGHISACGNVPRWVYSNANVSGQISMINQTQLQKNTKLGATKPHWHKRKKCIKGNKINNKTN